MMIITRAITRITTASFFPSASSERVSGVSTPWTCEIIVWILPISVFCPVATTTPVPVPATISVPEWTRPPQRPRERLSPRGPTPR